MRRRSLLDLVGAAALLLAAGWLTGCHHLRRPSDGGLGEGPTTPPPAYAGYGAAAGTGYGYGYGDGTGYGYGSAPGYGYGTAAPLPASRSATPAAAPAVSASAAGPGQSLRPPPAEPAAALRARAVAFARQQLGKPYCYGGTGPGCFDCSGLVYAAWRFAGHPVPRTSDELRDELAAIPWQDVRPGDVVWRPGHVGIYAGAGWVIHAPQTGEAVAYQPAERYRLALRP